MARSAKQRAALRKAQLASARKRRGKGKGKLARANRSIRKNRRRAIVAGAAVGLAGYAAGRGSKNAIAEGGRYRGRKGTGFTVNRKSRSVVVRGGGLYGAVAYPRKA